MRPLFVMLVLMGAILPTHAFAQDAIDQAKEAVKRPPTVVRVMVTPANTTISLGDKVVGQGTSELRLEAGTHEVKLSHEGYKTHIETLALMPGAPDIILRVHLKQNAIAPAPTTWEPGMVDDLGNVRPILGWTSLGLGVGLLGVGTMLAVNSHVDTRCSEAAPTRCAGAQEFAKPAVLTGGLGGAFLVTGIGLLIWDVLAATPKEDSLTLTPTLGTDGVGVRGSF